MKKFTFYPLLVACACFGFFANSEKDLNLLSRALAEESVVDETKDKLEDTKKDLKKGARTVKRKARNAAGKGSRKKDAQDKLNDVGDDASAEYNKLKRKVD